ncbi:hypothetical protein [Gemmata sp.]|uniref:hypothetical protein n=1 Tax=Gemmata sp. TaxID=1914242 RepID=UPI003F716081
MSFDISAGARLDAANAVRAYNRKPGRYGSAFQAEFGRAAAAVAAQPRLYPLVEDGVPGLEIREFFIKRFNQRVIYLVSGEDVLVVAVVHADSPEGSWHRNLPPGT